MTAGTPPLRMAISRDYGEAVLPWARILQNYDDMASANPSLADISARALALATAPFASAGLCALTSHSDILLGQSSSWRQVVLMLRQPTCKHSCRLKKQRLGER